MHVRNSAENNTIHQWLNTIANKTNPIIRTVFEINTSRCCLYFSFIKRFSCSSDIKRSSMRNSVFCFLGGWGRYPGPEPITHRPLPGCLFLARSSPSIPSPAITPVFLSTIREMYVLWIVWCTYCIYFNLCISEYCIYPIKLHRLFLLCHKLSD